MKSVLIRIQPKWCARIAKGEKTTEVRKTAPKLETPFKVYIYMTKGFASYPVTIGGNPYTCHNNGGMDVIGEFVCDDIKTYYADDFVGAEDSDGTIITEPKDGVFAYWIPEEKETCLPYGEILAYGNGKTLYGWHISDLKIYDKPRELSEFFTADKEAIRQCKNREQSYYAFTDTGYIKNGFYCREKDDWCFGGCKRKALTRPPQSWCYVEELNETYI